MKTLILANGKGERLRPLTETTPKSMLKVNNKPTLLHIIEHLKKYNFTEIIIAIGYKKEKIINYFKDGSEFGVNIKYSISEENQQTAGEIAKAKEMLKGEEFLLYYGDVLTNLDLTEFYETHKQSNTTITAPAMKEIFTESGIYVCYHTGTVKSFHEKPFINDIIELPGIFSNVPVYFLSKDIWKSKNIVFGKDFNKKVMPEFTEKNQVKIFYQQDLWHLDVGNLKKYKEICKAYEKGTQAELRKLA